MFDSEYNYYILLKLKPNYIIINNYILKKSYQIFATGHVE